MQKNYILQTQNQSSYFKIAYLQNIHAYLQNIHTYKIAYLHNDLKS